MQGLDVIIAYYIIKIGLEKYFQINQEKMGQIDILCRMSIKLKITYFLSNVKTG